MIVWTWSRVCWTLTFSCISVYTLVLFRWTFVGLMEACQVTLKFLENSGWTRVTMFVWLSNRVWVPYMCGFSWAFFFWAVDRERCCSRQVLDNTEWGSLVYVRNIVFGVCVLGWHKTVGFRNTVNSFVCIQSSYENTRERELFSRWDRVAYWIGRLLDWCVLNRSSLSLSFIFLLLLMW